MPFAQPATQASPYGTMKIVRGEHVVDRVRTMFGQVYKSLRWPMTRTIAVQMILQADCPAQNTWGGDKRKIDECQVAAIYWSFKNNGMYLGDVVNKDTYQTLARSLELGLQPSPVLAAAVQGFRGNIDNLYRQDLAVLFGAGEASDTQAKFIFDCDDAVICLCALLGSVGFRCGAKIISENGSEFGHTYAVVELPRYVSGPKYIVPLDATEFQFSAGDEPPRSARRAERIYWYQDG